MESDGARDGHQDPALGIAAASLQVSQAADELQEAARRLLAAEEQVREAEVRWRTAEEQVREAEVRWQGVDERIRDAEAAAAAAQGRAAETEARWRTAEEQLSESGAKSAELLEALSRTRETQSEADERARRAEQQLATTVERARKMADRLRELEEKVAEAEAKPEVTLIVDHERTALQEALAADVRRPLTSILGLTLALKHADPQSTDGADMIRQLATNARKLDRLVGEMLAVDQIAGGVFQPNLRRTDLEALVRRVVEETPDLANREVRIEAEHLAIHVDPALTEQMVETLLANAGRRTPPGTPVWVSISSDQGGAVIAVDDTGPEVPEGLRAAMAGTPTDRTQSGSRSQPQGATGLTLLARLAEIHGGRAWVEERPGGGASFRVLLPDAQEPTGKPDQESANDGAAARGRESYQERAAALARALAHADAEERRDRIRGRRRDNDEALEEVPGEITI